MTNAFCSAVGIPEHQGNSARLAEWLHDEAKDVFNKDKTHAQILFLFSGDEGLVSMNPIPPKTEPEQLLAGVRQAVQEHDIYGVITVAEVWTYIPQRPNDHITVQLRHNEMRVGDLKDEHRREALMVDLQSKDGEHLTWLDPIIRRGKEVTLGRTMVLPKEKCLNKGSYFEEGGAK